MTIVTLETSSFSFVGTAENTLKAEKLIKKAWREHRRQYGEHVHPFREFEDSVNYVECEIGQCFRDSSLIVTS